MFYLRLNDTSLDYYYWSQPARDWTSNHGDVTMFPSEEEAKAEAVYASETTCAEVEVCRAPSRTA